MFIQWCVKGISGPKLTWDGAKKMLSSGNGIYSNLIRNHGRQNPQKRRQNLTDFALEQHVNNYNAVQNRTPFISLAAGSVERDKAAQTNIVHRAVDTALGFATKNGTTPGYLFYCWVIVGLKPAVKVESVAEEIRDLNTYRNWSRWQLEGEITAKFEIPGNQICLVEKWDLVNNLPSFIASYKNLFFTPPETISNIRGLF